MPFGSKSEPAPSEQKVSQYGSWKDFQGDVSKQNNSGWLVVAAFAAPKTMKGFAQSGVGSDIIAVYERPKTPTA